MAKARCTVKIEVPLEVAEDFTDEVEIAHQARDAIENILAVNTTVSVRVVNRLGDKDSICWCVLHPRKTERGRGPGGG